MQNSITINKNIYQKYLFVKAIKFLYDIFKASVFFTQGNRIQNYIKGKRLAPLMI